MTDLTHEQMLKTVIEAQVRGGWKRYEWTLNSIENNFYGDFLYSLDDRIHILGEILLDTDGAKAAYKDLPMIAFNVKEGVMGYSAWKIVTFQILVAWHSGEGNNWRSAIDTAFQYIKIDPCPEDNV